MKYIKRLNIDFDNWDNIEYNSKKLIDVYQNIDIGDGIICSFNSKNRFYTYEHGIIICKNYNNIGVKFDNIIYNGHDGLGLCDCTMNCRFFDTTLDYDDLIINKIIKNEKKIK